MTTRRRTARPRSLALGYIRCSTQEQAAEGASIPAQQAALEAEATRRGWDLELVIDAGVSGKTLNRPGMQAALDRLDRGDADLLVAVRIDRLSRSVHDLSGLLERAAKRGWGVRLLDPDLDTTSSAGVFVTNVIAAAAQFERALLSQRTKAGMAAKAAQGVRMGRPTTLSAEVVGRIITERADGRTLQAIADGLARDDVHTAQGGVWRPSSVRKVLSGQAAQALAV